VYTYDKMYIGGSWVPPSGTGQLQVIDATTEEVMGTIPAGDATDATRAVAAAKGAFESWSQTAKEDRAKYLARIRDGLMARTDEIATVMSREIGMPTSMTPRIQVGAGIGAFAQASALAESYEFVEKLTTALVVREPIGVVGCITPWNYPLNQVGAKVAYAMAAGCTVVLKPSEVAPISIFMLAEIVDEVGLPPGVFNLVSGLGPVVGEVIAAHPDVDMVSFTGSTRAGRRVSELAAQTVKKVALELGGKSANVILDDADLSVAVPAGVTMAYMNSGQTCTAQTRMLVPRSRLAEIEELASAAARSFTVGNPFDETTRLGPLISSVQRDRVRGYIEKGVDEGAKLLTGGADAPEGLDRGYFVQPTVFSDVTSDMTIAQEEIFGPVLSILPYDTEEDAVRIANDTIYGLSGAVWSGDPERAKRVALRLRAGQVFVNGGTYDAGAPFGGYKQSGNGREHGRFGLEEFLEVKSLIS